MIDLVDKLQNELMDVKKYNIKLIQEIEDYKELIQELKLIAFKIPNYFSEIESDDDINQTE
jgi:hypothetical protein